MDIPVRLEIRMHADGQECPSYFFLFLQFPWVVTTGYVPTLIAGMSVFELARAPRQNPFSFSLPFSNTVKIIPSAKDGWGLARKCGNNQKKLKKRY
jgi:hypothetical protein